MKGTLVNIKIGDREEHLRLGRIDRRWIEQEIAALQREIEFLKTLAQHLDTLKEAYKEARHRLRYLRTGKGRKYLTLILHPDGSVEAKVDVVKRTEETFTLREGKWVKTS